MKLVENIESNLLRKIVTVLFMFIAIPTLTITHIMDFAISFFNSGYHRAMYELTTSIKNTYVFLVDLFKIEYKENTDKENTEKEGL